MRARMEYGTTAAFLYIPGVRAFDLTAPDAAVDPTTLTPKVAVIPIGTDPVDGDYTVAEWASSSMIRLKIGTAQTVSPTRGDYDVHAQVVGSTEVPRWKAGTLKVY